MCEYGDLPGTNMVTGTGSSQAPLTTSSIIKDSAAGRYKSVSELL